MSSIDVANGRFADAVWMIYGLLVYAVPISVLPWSLLRFVGSVRKREIKGRRVWFSVVALASAVVSFLIGITGIAWALAIGGFPYYDPRLITIYCCGFLFAVLGFLLGLAGEGRVRLPAVLTSLSLAIFWVLMASRE